MSGADVDPHKQQRRYSLVFTATTCSSYKTVEANQNPYVIIFRRPGSCRLPGL